MNYKNLKWNGERYDTDKIVSIELVNGSIIVISLDYGGRHSFPYGKENADEAGRDYDELMRLYNFAVAKRLSGEESKEREEEERKRFEELKRFYPDDEDEMYSKKPELTISSNVSNKNTQQTLF